ncbi:MAG: TIGR00730 family Rossman fold protein, partial [Planctomycetes bacterium]|nr:TIGR00730 family Rossman fold protein [Planctomycetota bacterium]
MGLARETWRLFRILSEFVDGFEVMSKVGPAVSVFGSARTQPDHPAYQQAMHCGRLICDAGFSV